MRRPAPSHVVVAPPPADVGTMRAPRSMARLRPRCRAPARRRRASHAARPDASAIAVAARSGVGNIGNRPPPRGRPPMTVTAIGTSASTASSKAIVSSTWGSSSSTQTTTHASTSPDSAIVRTSWASSPGDADGPRSTGLDHDVALVRVTASRRCRSTLKAGTTRRRRRRRRLRGPAGRRRCRRGRAAAHLAPADGRAGGRRRSSSSIVRARITPVWANRASTALGIARRRRQERAPPPSPAPSCRP